MSAKITLFTIFQLKKINIFFLKNRIFFSYHFFTKIVKYIHTGGHALSTRQYVWVSTIGFWSVLELLNRHVLIAFRKCKGTSIYSHPWLASFLQWRNLRKVLWDQVAYSVVAYWNKISVYLLQYRKVLYL